MKFAQNPNYVAGSQPGKRPDTFASVPALLAYQTDAHLVGLLFIEQTMAMTEPQALAACAAAGITVVDQ